MDPELTRRLTEFVEKAGLLRRDMQQHRDLEKYEARFARMDQKLAALIEAVAKSDPDAAKALQTAWTLPARSLAFRNAEHKRERDIDDR